MRFRVLLLCFVVLVLTAQGAAAWAPGLEDWDYRKLLTLNATAENLTDYQQLKTISWDSDMQADFDDLRFTTSNDANISYWIVSGSVVENVSVDVVLKIPQTSTSETTQIWQYYGNSGVNSASNYSIITYTDIKSSATSLYYNNSGNNDLAKIRDGSVDAHAWYTLDDTGGSVGYYFSGVKTITKIRFYSISSSERVKDFTVHQYDYGAWTKVPILSVAGNTALINTDEGQASNNNGWNEVSVSSVSDTRFRLTFTDTWNIGDSNAGISELEMYVFEDTDPLPTWGADGEEEYHSSNPDINTTLTSPINNTYTQYNNFTFNIAGNFTSANATLFIDSVPQWNGSITTGSNTAQNITLTEGLHSWYINATATASGNTTYNQSSNASFYYDISNPSVPTVQINPDYATISDGTIVNINLSWADNLQLKNGTFYIDTGSGYSEDSNTTLSGVSDWFNTSINTSGMVGNTITWKQEVYDQAGNNYTYSDSFYVALPNLLIYVYDETTGLQILPSDVTVYNEDVSRSATINGSTNISTLDYGNFTTGKYIVRVSAEGYYTRRSIALIDIETVSSLNVYLPDLNETVIFDQFILTDNTLLYDLSDCIIRLSKPLPNGTDTVFSSYFDFDGVASTYLIATDQYILYIETPDSVISYGWLTPDADGQIEIVITDPIEDLLDDWLSYSLTKSDAGSISLSYESDDVISSATFYVNTTGGTVLYTASITADTGSFTYAADVNESYWVSFTAVNVDGDVKTVTRLMYWNEDGPQPERLPLLPDDAPDWLYNLLSVGVIIIVVLLFSQIRADAACILGAAFSGMFWYWGWLKISGIVIAVAALIAVAAIMYKSRREGI